MLKKCIGFIVILLLLSGCGGGGAGNTAVKRVKVSDVKESYKGKVTQATLSKDNAMLFVADFFGETSRSVLNNTLESNDSCLTKKDNTDKTTNTGEIIVTLKGCIIDGITLNGSIVMSIDEYDFSYGEPKAFSLSFDGLMIDSVAGKLQAIGVMSYEKMDDQSELNIVDVYYKDASGEEYYYQNYQDQTEDKGLGFRHNYSGKFFIGSQGYVDISTPDPVTTDTFYNNFIIQGKLKFQGKSSAVMILPDDSLSSVYSEKIYINIDEDGDESYEYGVVQKESEDWKKAQDFSLNSVPQLSLSAIGGTQYRGVDDLRIGESVSLFAHTSISDIVEVSWYVNKAPIGSNAVINKDSNGLLSLTVDAIGEYKIKAEATNANGLKTAKFVDLIVKSNQPPTAVLSLLKDNYSLTIGNTIQLTSLDSYDNDENLPREFIASWALLSQPSGSTISLYNTDTNFASIKPDVAGEYIVELVLTDKQGAVGKTEFSLLISN